jgi:type IV secretory pathway VirB3-like protein
MQRTNLFTGLTRSVTFAGLPILYLAVLLGVSMLGFIVSKSFIYLGVSGSVGYGLLRGLAAYDPKIIDVIIATLRCTQMSPSMFTKVGVTYRA